MHVFEDSQLLSVLTQYFRQTISDCENVYMILLKLSCHLTLRKKLMVSRILYQGSAADIVINIKNTKICEIQLA